MSDLASVDATAAAARVVRERFGERVAVGAWESVAARSRSLVLRCHLLPCPDAPRSVIVKQQTSDDARGYSDWASLEFLSELVGARGVAPGFYGGDAAARLYVMQDLGGSRTLADVVAQGDVAEIRVTLRSLADTMARLVAATAGPALEARYERLRGGLPGGREVGRHGETDRWRAGWPKVAAWFAALDCTIGARLEDDVARVADAYAEPGPFLSFSHGDPAPSNNHVGPDTVRLLDFEYGAYRHALYDVTGWYVLCPLPEAWAAELHSTFRKRLVRARALAVDEARYREAWATMCAFRAIAMLSWLPQDIVSGDRPWVEDWTMRGALLTAATRLGRATAGVDGLEALAEAGSRLSLAARRRWPELGEGLPRWPGGTAVR